MHALDPVTLTDAGRAYLRTRWNRPEGADGDRRPRPCRPHAPRT